MDKLIKAVQAWFNEQGKQYRAEILAVIGPGRDNTGYENEIREINRLHGDPQSTEIQQTWLLISCAGKMRMRLNLEDVWPAYLAQGEKAVDAFLQEVMSGKVRMEKIAGEMEDYEKARNRLILRPFSYAKIRKAGRDAIFRKCGDIALVLYGGLDEQRGVFRSFRIHRSMTQNWQVSDEEMIDEALRNTQKKYPALIYEEWADYVSGNDAYVYPEDADSLGEDLIMTTACPGNGAVAMFYPGIGKILNEKTGGCYIVPTGTEEVNVRAMKDFRPEKVSRALRDLNREFQESMLSEMLWIFDEEGNIRPFEFS